jgi:hypothetical protein
MKSQIKFGDHIIITRDDNYQQTFEQKAIATGKIFVEVLLENGLKENIELERIRHDR